MKPIVTTPPELSRRDVLATLSCIALTACTSDRLNGHRSTPTPEPRSMLTPSTRMPVVFLPHGGGPWPFVNLGFGTDAEQNSLKEYLRSIRDIATPRAVLMVSAHWESETVTIMTSHNPPMLYDYYGFPEESYRITWPAPGMPSLATRVQELLTSAHIASQTDGTRGFDHGAFVPMKVAWPDAHIPTVQLSLREGLDPSEHLAIGRALAPLRDEGVLILGSGMSYHNLGAFRRGPSEVTQASRTFDEWLCHTTLLDSVDRDRALTQWASAPAARRCHPREEHLLPLMVVAGAAGTDRGRIAWQGDLMNARLSAHHFG
jgi:aromatic ring-opening dioxygenase catalytic subunit (LigB family)